MALWPPRWGNVATPVDNFVTLCGVVWLPVDNSVGLWITRETPGKPAIYPQICWEHWISGVKRRRTCGSMGKSSLWPYWRCLRAQALEEAVALRLLLEGRNTLPRCVPLVPPSVDEWRRWRRMEQDRTRRERW